VAIPDIGVVKEDDDSFTGVCACGYKTSFWPMQKHAAERIREHAVEHRDGTPMTPISEFRAKHGLEARGMRAVLPEGARKVSLEDEE
jgi:hypothetical protein